MGLHAVVENVVSAYLEAVDTEAPGLIEGLYLTGSVALNDFHPRASDIDFVAVTAQPLDADATGAVEQAHARLRKRFPRPAFEGSYVTWDQLASDPAHSGHEPVTWHTLARHGIACRGPHRADLKVWTNTEVLAKWTLGNLESYWQPLLDRSRVFGTRWNLMALTTYGAVWIVLGVTRLHYTLATGEIGSKENAGRYSLRTFPEEWHRVIQESLRLRQSDRASPDIAGAIRGLVDRESLYRSPFARRRDVLAFGNMVIRDAKAKFV
ncbi:MAG TPA: aminoglycoside adenylyltransferase domain-containing protein [Bryobacteraceae bacterium]|nr:aminoglycoside adenylyltransferase domain-containing protein [Bryobacteraceae bacterium]